MCVFFLANLNQLIQNNKTAVFGFGSFKLQTDVTCILEKEPNFTSACMSSCVCVSAHHTVGTLAHALTSPKTFFPLVKN